MNIIFPTTRYVKYMTTGGVAMVLTMLVLFMGIGGCTFLGLAAENAMGVAVKPQYRGLEKQSVAIVVYEDASTMFTYPQAQQEVSAFVSAALKKHLPKAHILDYHLVLNYQNANPNWDVLPVKTIGRHFGVSRVVYIELLNYTVHSQQTNYVLQGDIAAHVAVYNMNIPGDGEVFHTDIDARWPKGGPLPGYNTDANTVRMNTLQRFSTLLARCFYTWHNRGNGYAN